MSAILHKNLWGSQGSNLDPQRTDLFRFVMTLPPAIGGSWEEHVSFAVERFPFPERSQQTFDMKYLNQVNHILGSDQATAPVEIPVRYAFTQATAQLLYRWHYLVSNPRTGSVVRTTEVKTYGEFRWLIPRKLTPDIIDRQEFDPNALETGLIYSLEGCMPINLKPTDANMTEGNQYVTLTFRLSIDRFYPKSLNSANMIFA